MRSRTGEEHPFHQGSAYSPECLSAIAEVLARDAAAGVETWFIFDNTAAFAATGDALTARRLVEAWAEP
ncbi:hypothetical protein BB934_42710 (plasmid) [Microvirga ossetica]|uniref:DUF72 domain-containing protein n=1 Tax=Microvirga ossetica TaxID=1882682 RepID=A0A1B2EYC8_9HYPH|nr:hypothetical protein [Microvirga ossetica]ANY84943.1 hypothetical protein BB934_42710 [Microvirga ossetica]